MQGNVSLQLFLVVWIGCHLLWQISSQSGSQKKLLQELVSHELTAYLSVFDLFLTKWIMSILSKGCKPDHFEPHNSLKLSFTNIRCLCSNFVECGSFLESNSLVILALCETNLDDSKLILWISLWGFIFLFEGLSSYSITDMHVLAVYVKKGLPFAQDLYLENSADSYLCFRLALLHSVSYFIFLCRSPSALLCMVFDLFCLT